jgi:hypothetical protein
MRLCLSCFRFHSDNDLYCPYCGRTPGARRCKKGHASPPGARRCAECGSSELSDPGRSVGCGAAAPLLSLACVLLLLRLASAHLRALAGLAFRALLWTAGFALDLPPCGFVRLLFALSFWLAAAVLATFLLPSSLRGGARAGIRLGQCLLGRLARLLLRLVVSLLRSPKAG